MVQKRGWVWELRPETSYVYSARVVQISPPGCIGASLTHTHTHIEMHTRRHAGKHTHTHTHTHKHTHMLSLSLTHSLTHSLTYTVVQTMAKLNLVWDGTQECLFVPVVFFFCFLVYSSTGRPVVLFSELPVVLRERRSWEGLIIKCRMSNIM